jgi:hypothetical protein
VKASSVALLDHMNASPGRRFAIFSGVSEPRAAFAFWMCLSHAGELNLWRMTWLESSMSETGTDGGSWLATMMLVPCEWMELAPKVICPKGGGDCLHHGAVEVWDRVEDEAGSVAKVENGVVTVSAKTKGFLGRRGDVRISFKCEGCTADLQLGIMHHKGQTLMASSTGGSPKLVR